MSISKAKIRKRLFRTRLEQRRRPVRRDASINLVSMMDIFTILVFFLLVNSGDVESLSAKPTLVLPESYSDAKPQPTIVISLDKHDVLVQGRKVTTLAEVEAASNDFVPALKKELDYQAKRLLIGQEKSGEGAVTIMGDKDISYRIIKKVMATCAQSNFGKISLAVQQRE